MIENKISSLEHPLVKLAASLHLKKYRQRENAFLLEGPRYILDAVDGGLDVRQIFVSDQRDDLSARLSRGRGAGIPKVWTSLDVLQKISDTKESQGIAAVVGMPPRKEVGEMLYSKSVVMALDGVADPSNVGAMTRTAAAFGFAGVLLLEGCADPFCPKSVRASAGTVLKIPFASSDGNLNTIFKNAGARVYAADSNDGKNLRQVAHSDAPTVLIMGSEARGLSKAIMKIEHQKIMIPLKGGVDSLNVAAAAAIMAYEFYR